MVNYLTQFHVDSHLKTEAVNLFFDSFKASYYETDLIPLNGRSRSRPGLDQRDPDPTLTEDPD